FVGCAGGGRGSGSRDERLRQGGAIFSRAVGQGVHGSSAGSEQGSAGARRARRAKIGTRRQPRSDPGAVPGDGGGERAAHLDFGAYPGGGRDADRGARRRSRTEGSGAATARVGVSARRGAGEVERGGAPERAEREPARRGSSAESRRLGKSRVGSAGARAAAPELLGRGRSSRSTARGRASRGPAKKPSR